jgi:hypothetical protein
MSFLGMRDSSLFAPVITGNEREDLSAPDRKTRLILVQIL